MYFVSLLWGKYKQHSKFTKNFCYYLCLYHNKKYEAAVDENCLVQIHTSSTISQKLVRFFMTNIFLTKNFPLKILKLTLIANPLIYKASSEEKGTGQYPVRLTQKPRIGDFRQLKFQKHAWEHACRPPYNLRKSISIILSRTCAWESSNWCTSMHVWS